VAGLSGIRRFPASNPCVGDDRCARSRLPRRSSRVAQTRCRSRRPARVDPAATRRDRSTIIQSVRSGRHRRSARVRQQEHIRPQTRTPRRFLRRAVVPPTQRKGRTVPSTQAKLYLTDPLLAWIPNLLRAGAEPPDFTRLTEQTIGVGLARSIDDHESGRWIAADTIGYSRTSTGNEVDLAPVNVATPGGPRSTTPIESKWVDNGWRREALTIEGKFARGVVATKTILDFDSPSWGIPAPLLMMLVGP
jgi:hypothetical protein